MAYLILVRHGLTDWNKEGKWQGWTDIPINDEGIAQARSAATSISDIKIDKAYTSDQIRTKQSFDQICDTLGLQCPVEHIPALKERNYGIYTGKNKWDVQKEVGEEAFQQIRRVYDHPIPEGESLKDVYDRAVPFYEQNILPELKAGQNILVVSSNNTLRALIKYLDNMTNEEVAKFELGFADVYVYQINHDGKVIDKQVRSEGLYKGKM